MRHSWTKHAICAVNNKKWRKWYNFILTLLFNNTYGLPVITRNTKYPNQLFYVWLVDLQFTCTKYGLETLISRNDDICKCVLDMKHGSNKNAFSVVNNKKWHKWGKFVSPSSFNNTYGLPVLTMDTKCPSQVFYDWLVDL
jgi:hypothetical protein